MWNAFVILRVVATARYLHLKSQELHEALREAHMTIGEQADERVRLRGEIPAFDARDKTVALLAAMSAQHKDAQAASSRISLRPVTTSPQPWSRPTRKWRTWTIG